MSCSTRQFGAEIKLEGRSALDLDTVAVHNRLPIDARALIDDGNISGDALLGTPPGLTLGERGQGADAERAPWSKYVVLCFRRKCSEFTPKGSKSQPLIPVRDARALQHEAMARTCCPCVGSQPQCCLLVYGMFCE